METSSQDTLTFWPGSIMSRSPWSLRLRLSTYDPKMLTLDFPKTYERWVLLCWKIKEISWKHCALPGFYLLMVTFGIGYQRRTWYRKHSILKKSVGRGTKKHSLPASPKDTWRTVINFLREPYTNQLEDFIMMERSMIHSVSKKFNRLHQGQM